MKELLFRAVAWLVSRRPVRMAILRYAVSRPYEHITDPSGTDVYMRRYWVFNSYFAPNYRKRLPSIRLHAIRRPDQAPHEHDHPWTFRTFILSGGYIEERDGIPYMRVAGDTATLPAGTFHRIVKIMPGEPCITLFVTYRKQCSWGFNVDGVRVPWRVYLGGRV
jgi:hypothetical protein